MLWRTLKSDAVYQQELADARDPERRLLIPFLRRSRPHSSLGGRTPGEVNGTLWGKSREPVADYGRERHGTRRVKPLRGSSTTFQPSW